ncbi:MAG: (Fe-S)-binding protein [Terriglobales bacterium]
MFDDIQSPAEAVYWGIPGHLLFATVQAVGLLLFLFILAQRLRPLLNAAADCRWDRPLQRFARVLKFWLGQWKHPRYRTAGIIHLLLFSGFIILVIRAFSLLFLGLSNHFVMPIFPGRAGAIYEAITQYASTIVFVCVVVAVVRRVVFKPSRYAVPPRFGSSHGADAIFLLALIGILMLADGVFEGSRAVMQSRAVGALEMPSALSLPWVSARVLWSASHDALWVAYRGGYLLHVLTFYFLLCYRPFGIQFHVETSLFNVFFSKLDREQLKPVRWGETEEQIANGPSQGVKQFQDFTWKQILDFYSCADCGRCSDQCPSNAAGRPLSPRFLTIKGRDYSFRHYPVFGKPPNGTTLVGSVYSEDEIWSCTTCGACEEECPLLIEYIDKIVDLRRGLIDEGRVPATLQKPLKALESRGNPYGKLEKKRADWTKVETFQSTCPVRVVNGAGADTLYFVDSMTSYDDRMQCIARAAARILAHSGEDFAILGAAERDSGHEVRRFGEEMLFFSLRDHNLDAIKKSGATKIVTADPHAYNALKRDYSGLPPVAHISEAIAHALDRRSIEFNPLPDSGDVYTFHDPCYLGRHNHVYDAPRDVLDAIPGLKRTEMKRSRDRSFCCGGGGLMLFYEPKEEERMGVKRVRMAADAGANVIVTACPFCLANIEDAIKVAGFEESMRAIDLAELAEQQLARDPRARECRDEHSCVRQTSARPV